MKALLIFLALTLSAQAQMRDSTYTVDSTATAIGVTIQLTAKQAAGAYRAFGVDWQEGLRSTVVHIISQRDPLREQREQWEELQSTDLTNQQKRAVALYLKLQNPRIVQVLKKIAVPVLEQP